MDAPKCRVCGAAHWPREPHKFDAKAVGAIMDSALRKSTKRIPCPECAKKDAEIVSLTALLAQKPAEPVRLTKFDRAVYQRELMRRRRDEVKKRSA